MKKFFKFKSKVDKWKYRDLTIEGKKLLINSYIMSSISYLADIYSHKIPDKYIKETKSLICKFLWKGKSWRISQANLGMRKVHGGQELKDLDTFFESKKNKWVVKTHFSPLST